MAWLFGEQEDSKGEEEKGESKAADEEGAPPKGDGSPTDETYWYADENGPPSEGHSIRESEEDDYMDILKKLMRHWAGLAMEGKLQQWSVVQRRWFGMLAVQRWGREEL